MTGYPVARIGDQISHGGSITQGSLTVFTNSIGVARLGDAVHCNIHGAQTISSASLTVFANSKGVARVGDSVSCGATITIGSSTVFVGG